MGETAKSLDFDDVSRAFGNGPVAASILAAKPVFAVIAEPYVWIDPESLPVRPWVYGKMWQRGCVALVVAPGATGKTAKLVGDALSLASGRPLLGYPVWEGPKRVWLWNLEDSKMELRRLVQAAAKWHGVAQPDLEGQLFLNSGLDGDGLVITEMDGRGFSIRRPVVQALVDELKLMQIDVLIVDPFVSCHSVPENDNSAMDMVAKEWARVATAANCVVVLAHHTTKLGDGAATAEKARGASALVNAARSAIAINRMSEKEAETFGIGSGEAGRYIKAYDDKPNRAPRASQCEWFYLQSVLLNNGGMAGLLPGDNMPVVVPWQPPATIVELTDVEVAHIQTEILTGSWREDIQAKDWAGKAVAKVLGWDLDKPGAKAAIKKVLRQLTERGAIEVAEAKDGRGTTRKFLRSSAPMDETSPLPRQRVGQGEEVEPVATTTTPLPLR